MSFAASWLRALLSTRLTRCGVIRWCKCSLRLHCFLAIRLQVLILAPFSAFTPQHGKSPLDYAQTTGKAAVVQLLRAAEDTCSLHIAADEGSEPIVRRLLAMGAPVNAADEVREYRAPAS